MPRIARVAPLVVATLLVGVLGIASAGSAAAQEPTPTPAQSTVAPPPAASSSASPEPREKGKPVGQGIAVLAIGPARDDAFALARAIYGSRLRPTTLDEIRARVLAGAPPPPNASRELRELAEVRAGITGEDAAGRRLLAGLAQQVGAEALLVVKVDPPAPAAAAPAAPAAPDGGASGDAGNALASPTVTARLFLTNSGDFDAARYAPEAGLDGPAAWKSTVTSLEARFPAQSRVVGPNAATAPAPVRLKPEDEKSSPFYASGWFWGAVGAAALLGGAFYFATRDTGSDPIHLQLKVPR